MMKLSVARLGVFCFLATGDAFASSSYVQPEEQYRKAFENSSTSPSYVLITVIAQNTGTEHVGCVPANFVIGAIEKEDEGRTPHAGAITAALANLRHVFTFSRKAALDNLALNDPKSIAACAIIRSGYPAYMTDRTGMIREGQPDR